MCDSKRAKSLLVLLAWLKKVLAPKKEGGEALLKCPILSRLRVKITFCQDGVFYRISRGFSFQAGSLLSFLFLSIGASVEQSRKRVGIRAGQALALAAKENKKRLIF